MYYYCRGNESNIVKAIYLLHPISLNSKDDLISINLLNKIFKFVGSEHVSWLVNAMLEELSSSDKFEKGNHMTEKIFEKNKKH